MRTPTVGHPYVSRHGLRDVQEHRSKVELRADGFEASLHSVDTGEIIYITCQPLGEYRARRWARDHAVEVA